MEFQGLSNASSRSHRRGSIDCRLPLAYHHIVHTKPKLISKINFTKRALGLDKDREEGKGSRILFDILEPITSLQGLEFWNAYWEVINCHYILWREGIQHGDISVSNLMHRKGTGVLNDFDLAALSTRAPGNEHSRGIDRLIGTASFLALDLLAEEAQAGRVERRYRHDLESFLWVLMWIAAGYDNGVESIPATHRSWLDDNTGRCRASKYTMLREETTTPSYLPLFGVIAILQSHWKNYYDERDKESRRVRIASSLGLPSDLERTMELSDEEVLLSVVDALASHPLADIITFNGLMPNLPLTLFSANANTST